MRIQTSNQNSAHPTYVKLGASRQIAIPKHLWRELELKSGEYVEVKKHGKELLLIPKAFIDKDVEESFTQSFKDFEEGRAYGPFFSIDEMFKVLDQKKRGKTKKNRK